MSDSASSHSDSAPPTRTVRWRRRLLQGLGLSLGLVLLVIGGLLLGLQTERGATAAAQWLTSIANPLPNTQLTVEHASGSWLRSLRLTNVTLSRTDTRTGTAVPMAQIDTLSAQYRLLPLLQGHLHVTDVAVIGPDVTARQAADSTWDWARVLPEPAADPPPADTSAGLSIQVDRMQLRRGNASVAFYRPNRDSTAHVRDVTLRARDFTADAAITGRLDTLGLRGQLPNAAAPDLQLGLRGTLSASSVTLDTLHLNSPRSQVQGQGTVQWANAPDSEDNDIDLHLRAAPFALRDLTPFLPALDVDPTETLWLDLQAAGSPRRITVRTEGRFSNGGALSAEAVAAPLPGTAPSPPLSYQLDAEVRGLTTSLLGAPDPLQNRLNATLSADLQGPSLTSLNGPIDLRLKDTHWNGLHAPTLAFTSTLRDGTAALNLNGTLNEAAIEATGKTRPLDDAPDATMTAQIRTLDLAQFAPNAGIESTIAATAEMQARSLGADAQTIDLSVTLDSSQVGVQSIASGTVALGLHPDRATFDGALTLPAGTVRTNGVAELDGSERFELTQMRLDNVNPAALLGDTTSSRLTGTATVTGEGFTPETMRLDATASLSNSHYGPYHLSSFATEAALTNAELTSTTTATLNGSNWTLALTGTPFADTPAFELARGRFSRLDIGPFLQDTTQSSRLAGTVRGRVQGTDPASMTAELGLTLDSSRVNQQQIDAASLDLRLADAQVDTRFALTLPDGGTQFTATARPFDDVPTVRIPDGSFDALNVGALADLPSLQTALSGTFTLEGRGASAETLALDADLSFASSQINNATLSEGRLTVSAEQGQAQTKGRVSVGDGHIGLTGQVDSLDETPTYTARATAGSLDVGALAGLDSLTARVDTLRWTLDGSGVAPDTLTTTTDFAAAGQIEALAVNAATLSGRFQNGQLAVDTLDVRSNAFTAAGSGTLAVTNPDASSDLSIRAGFINLKPLGRLLGVQELRLQDSRLEARIYGSSLATQRFDGELELQNLLYNEVRLAETELHFNGQRGTDQLLKRLELNGTLGYLSVPSLSINQTRFNAIYDGTTVDLSGNVRIDPTHKAALNTQIRPGAEKTEITLQKLTLNFEKDRWTLLQEATITAGDRYRIRGFLLHSGSQQVAIDGIVDPQGTQSLVATIEEVRLGSFAPLVGLSGVNGRLSGSIDLTGPADAPLLDSRLSLDLRTEDRDVGTLRFHTHYEDLALALDATLTHVDGSTLTAKGHLPTDLRLNAPTPADVSTRPVQLDLSTESFSINWIDPFLDPASVRNIRGVLAADVAVRGTLADPALSGSASLAKGGMTLPSIKTTYHKAKASLDFVDDQLRLSDAALRSSNDGRLQAEGTINFPELTVGEFDLSVEANDFIAINTRAYRRAVIDGNMSLKGTTAQPVLDGTVKVRSAEIFYNEALAESESGASAVSLTADDKLTLENRFGIRLSAADTTAFDAYDGLKMDLEVNIQRNTWLRSRSNPEMNVQFKGNLDVSKAPENDPQVFGSIEVVPERSTLRQFGQEFQIREGVLTFNGDPTNPYLNLKAIYEQKARGTQGSEVTITLGLEGRPETLSPTLSSIPAMDTRNILSYLATGRPADELLSGSGEGSGNMATQMALGQAASIVENLAASELGLDVVRVQLRTSGESYLTVGRYLTPRFFASVQQPVTTSNLNSDQNNQYLPDLTLEYQLFDTLILRARNNQQSFQMDLLFEYAY